jgi:hypothetical protein
MKQERRIIRVKTGDRFGRWTVVKELKPGKWRMRRIMCKCDCGKRKSVLLASLKKSGSQSCGCLHRERMAARRIHPLKDQLLYRVWKGMKARCFNPKRRAFKDYGGRGITVCNEWKNDASTFIKWCRTNGWSEKLTIDRIDNNGHYEPSNVQFISKPDNTIKRACWINTQKRNTAIEAALSLPV